jgi:septum formation protein
MPTTSSKKEKFSFILASKSPRRKEMVSWLGIPYSIRTADIDEVSLLENPGLKSEDIAKKKGLALCEMLMNDSATPSFLVLAADTIVSIGSQYFGKPKSESEARETLKFLSGKTHQVHTGVYLGLYQKGDHGIREATFHCKTNVEFYETTKDLIALYLESGEYKDKAGSYGIQGKALTFIKEIQGSYSNVVGLPLAEVILKIKELFSYEDRSFEDWREYFQ